MQSFAVDAIAERHRHWFLKKWDMFTAYLENYRQCIFYIFVFYVITFALFMERFVYYAFMAEHRFVIYLVYPRQKAFKYTGGSENLHYLNVSY